MRNSAVAIFGQLLQGSAGGIETNLLRLLAELAKENGLDDRQYVIGPGGASPWLRGYLGRGQDVLEWQPLRYDVAGAGRAGSPAAVARRIKQVFRKLLRRGAAKTFAESAAELTRKLKQMNVEVVHFPYQRYFPTTIPFIFEPWDLQHIHLPELFSREEVEFRNTLYRRACDEATLVVTATRWTKADIVSRFGIPESKIAVIRRGADATASKGAPEQACALDALNLPERFALYPAKTWAHKNHGRLFQALAYLRDKEKIVIPLVCTGKPIDANAATIQQSLRALRLEDQVSFTGFLDERSLQQLFARADLMIFPSLFEGLGIPVLEAMTAGLPVACSRASCLPEIGGDAAVYFDPYSVEDIAAQVAKVWGDPTLRAKLVQQGYANIAGYGWNEAAHSFRVLYKHVAKRPLEPPEARLLKGLLS